MTGVGEGPHAVPAAARQTGAGDDADACYGSAARLMAGVLIFLIRIYQRAISPWLGNACRFEPSCSRYAAACLETHGAARGSLLSLARLCKCHPFHPGGYDPPPPP